MRQFALLLLAVLAACSPSPVSPFPAAVPSLVAASTSTPVPSPVQPPTRTPLPSPTAVLTVPATPTLAPVDFYDPAGCIRPPDEAGEVVEVNGWMLNQRTLAMLQTAQELYGGPVELAGAAVTQGSYHDNGSLSFGTHLGGGAVDLSIFLPGTWQVDFAGLPRLVRSLRAAGFAAWVRVIDEVYPGSGYHIHAVAVGDPELSDAAEAQLTGTYGYFHGFDGLPREDGVPVADREGGPLLCGWMRELGYRDLRETPAPAAPELPSRLEPAGQVFTAAPGEAVAALAHRLYTVPEGLERALAWGIWGEAGLLPGIPNPARTQRSWLNFATDPDAFWRVFPPESYLRSHTDSAPAQFDFSADPLRPGDLLALSSPGQGVLAVVTRVDETGRAYAPAALRGPDGWRVDLALLYDPSDPAAGLLGAEWGAFPAFDRLRPLDAAPAPGSSLEYTVQPGDSLPALAARFHSSVEAIRRANPDAPAEQLEVGQPLTIPAAR